MTALAPDAVAHHLDLFRQLPGGFDQGACVTVLPGSRDLEEVLGSLGEVIRREDALDVDAFAEAAYSRWDRGTLQDEFVWVVRDGSYTVLLESVGFAGTLPEVLRPLSGAGHLAASTMWIDSNGASAICLARDGETEQCQADYGSAEVLRACPGLAPYLPEVWAMTDDGWPGYRAGGLAALEMITGFRLTSEHFAGRWPAVWFRVRRRPA